MRWIDIDLAGPGVARRHFEAAATRFRDLPRLQQRAGLDSPEAVALMAEVGQLLFRAVTAIDPRAFADDRAREGGVDPRVGIAETDHLTGYHLRVRPEHLTLPWTWLHNGVEFLLARCAIAASPAGSRPATARAPEARAWMRRHRDSLFTQDALGSEPLSSWLEQLRPAGTEAPEILFLAGHCEEEVRPLIYREADAIRRALAVSPLQRPLARLAVPERALTPNQLRRRGGAFQGFHFAGPTARPPVARIETAWEYLQTLGAAARPEDPGADGSPVGSGADTAADVGELDYVGVDPITAILDELSDRAARQEELAAPMEPVAAEPAPREAAEAGAGGGASGPARASGRSAAAGPPWLLEDGPIHPEELARVGGAPPLVFSNSYLSLPDLGPRFLEAGASVFVGPVAPVMSQAAREFAARFYGCLAGGYCAAAALRSASMGCREHLGADNPVWLSYGLVGYGSLALQYL